MEYQVFRYKFTIPLYGINGMYYYSIIIHVCEYT